jgi:hypothetical protein
MGWWAKQFEHEFDELNAALADPAGANGGE